MAVDRVGNVYVTDSVNHRVEKRSPDGYRLALLGTGQHIGYRVTESGGHWVARKYDSETRKRVYRSLGDLTGTPDADRYSRAAKLAGEWFKHLDGGGEASPRSSHRE